MSLFKLWFLFAVVPNLGGAAVGIIILSVTTITGSIIVYAIGRESHDNTNINLGTKVFRSSLVALLIGGVLAVLTPSEKQMYVIAGGYAVTNNEEIKKMPTATLKAANAWIERLERAAATDKAPSEPSQEPAK